MKKISAAAAALAALLLSGCARTADPTPVWQTDLPVTGVHIELSGAELLSDAPVLYAHTREDSARNHYLDMPAVQAEGAPVVTFYGVTAEDISLVFLESIGELYVDYDRVKPQVELDYRLTQGDDSVSYRLDTAYNFEFTIKTQQGSDTLLVVSRRSDITG